MLKRNWRYEKIQYLSLVTIIILDRLTIPLDLTLSDIEKPNKGIKSFM